VSEPARILYLNKLNFVFWCAGPAGPVLKLEPNLSSLSLENSRTQIQKPVLAHSITLVRDLPKLKLKQVNATLRA